MFDCLKEHVRRVKPQAGKKFKKKKIFWLQALCLPNKSTRIMFTVSKAVLGEPQNKTPYQVTEQYENRRGI